MARLWRAASSGNVNVVTVRHAPPFTLQSAGNGACYLLTHVAARRDVFFQGDDAIDFETELEALEMLRPETSTSAILAELWNLYAEFSAPIKEGV